MHLGHIGEQHYVPLNMILHCEYEIQCPKYNDAFSQFYIWAKSMEKDVNEYLDSQNRQSTIDKSIFSPFSPTAIPITIQAPTYAEVITKEPNKENQINYE